MEKELLSTACWNSGLLALFFLGATFKNFRERHPIWGVIAALATIFTICDTVRFYNLM